MSLLPPAFDTIRSRHPAIHVIVSPPRCGSTALARVFWEHPSVRYYSHEPFEITYYQGAGLDDVAAKLAAPLDLAALAPEAAPEGRSLVIKEMPYQVGDHFMLLARLATPPLVFLLRDPRLNIASRMDKKRQVGDSPFFPLVETGWTLLAQQIDACRQAAIPYLIVEASDFRNAPEAVLPRVFEQAGLAFSPAMLAWQAYHEVDLDNLGGAHSHLYRRVLTSTGIQPATEALPPLDAFPTAHGFRDHVATCLDLYHRLCHDAQRITPEERSMGE